jgi:hypothetical protein
VRGLAEKQAEMRLRMVVINQLPPKERDRLLKYGSDILPKRYSDRHITVVHMKDVLPKLSGEARRLPPRKCHSCEQKFPAREFFVKHKRNLLKRIHHCKTCYPKWKEREQKRRVREHWMFRCFGMTQREYSDLLCKQHDRCRICHQKPRDESVGKKRHLGIDHNHATGEIRGLLCDRCNKVLGFVREDQALLRRAVLYLKRAGTGKFIPKDSPYA